MPTVADLLSQSRAHTRNRLAAANRHPPNYAHAINEATAALATRQDAHALDPDHFDDAWAEDEAANKGVTHDTMLAFLERYCTT